MPHNSSRGYIHHPDDGFDEGALPRTYPPPQRQRPSRPAPPPAYVADNHFPANYRDSIRYTATIRARAVTLLAFGLGLLSTLTFNAGLLAEIAISVVWTVVMGALYPVFRWAFVGIGSTYLLSGWNAHQWTMAASTPLGAAIEWDIARRRDGQPNVPPADDPNSPAWLAYAASLPPAELADLLTNHRHRKAVTDAVDADAALTAYQRHLTGGAAALMDSDTWLREEARLRANLTGGQP